MDTVSEDKTSNYIDGTALDTKVIIRNLYKIFGSSPSSMVERVENGMSKKELLDKHDHVLALTDVNIDIPSRRIQVIMGLSGSGKSTLIRHVNRLIEPTTGEVIVDGQNVLEMNQSELREFRRHRASMVFQRFALLPHHTVSDNVAFGLSQQLVCSACCVTGGADRQAQLRELGTAAGVSIVVGTPVSMAAALNACITQLAF